MIIEEKDFRLIPVSDSSTLFDLELLYTIKPKGKEIRQEFKNIAYGISLELAIKKVIQYRISCNHDIISLGNYLSEFKKELITIKNLCNL